MRLKLICFVLVGLLVVVATGCGSKKKAASNTPTTTSQATTPTTSTSAANLTSTDCTNFAAATQTINQAMTGSVSNNLAAQIQRLSQVVKIAPAAIKGDLETILGAAQQFEKLGLKPGATPTPKQMQALQRLPVKRLTAAAQHIGAWAKANCGVK